MANKFNIGDRVVCPDGQGMYMDVSIISGKGDIQGSIKEVSLPSNLLFETTYGVLWDDMDFFGYYMWHFESELALI